MQDTNQYTCQWDPADLMLRVDDGLHIDFILAAHTELNSRPHKINCVPLKQVSTESIFA